MSLFINFLFGVSVQPRYVWLDYATLNWQKFVNTWLLHSNVPSDLCIHAVKAKMYLLNIWDTFSSHNKLCNVISYGYVSGLVIQETQIPRMHHGLQIWRLYPEHTCTALFTITVHLITPQFPITLPSQPRFKMTFFHSDCCSVTLYLEIAKHLIVVCWLYLFSVSCVQLNPSVTVCQLPELNLSWLSQRLMFCICLVSPL